MLRYAYNTNGTSNHRLDDALALIANAGYSGVALTLDHHHFDPFAPNLEQRAHQLKTRLDGLGLGLVIETGARYLLDPSNKHEPTLITPDAAGRARRVDFLERAITIAAVCGAEAVSFWAGVPQPDLDHDRAWSYLVDGVCAVVEQASAYGVDAAFEPEPGMLVETLADFERLHADVPDIRLALDVGHCLVTDDADPAAAVRRYAADVATVSIEDMRRGVHEHLPFGTGDMDTLGVLRALHEVDFQRLVCVELSRESHRAHAMVGEAIAYLHDAEQQL